MKRRLLLLLSEVNQINLIVAADDDNGDDVVVHFSAVRLSYVVYVKVSLTNGQGTQNGI